MAGPRTRGTARAGDADRRRAQRGDGRVRAPHRRQCGYVAAFPKQGEVFTDFYPLSEQEDGTLAADNYLTEFVASEPESLVVGIGNHEPVVESERLELSTRAGPPERQDCSPEANGSERVQRALFCGSMPRNLHRPLHCRLTYTRSSAGDRVIPNPTEGSRTS